MVEGNRELEPKVAPTNSFRLDWCDIMPVKAAVSTQPELLAQTAEQSFNPIQAVTQLTVAGAAAFGRYFTSGELSVGAAAALGRLIDSAIPATADDRVPKTMTENALDQISKISTPALLKEIEHFKHFKKGHPNGDFNSWLANHGEHLHFNSETQKWDLSVGRMKMDNNQPGGSGNGSDEPLAPPNPPYGSGTWNGEGENPAGPAGHNHRKDKQSQ